MQKMLLIHFFILLKRSSSEVHLAHLAENQQVFCSPENAITNKYDCTTRNEGNVPQKCTLCNLDWRNGYMIPSLHKLIYSLLYPTSTDTLT